MKYLSGLLVVTVILVSLSATAAVAQTPSSTATQTSVPTPTAPPSATPTPNTPPIKPTLPVIVDVTGSLGPGPITSVKPEVFWKGVGDTSVNYELERSGTDNAATRDFQRLATIPGNAPGASGLYSYFDANPSFALEVCYRVRVVSGSLPGSLLGRSPTRKSPSALTRWASARAITRPSVPPTVRAYGLAITYAP